MGTSQDLTNARWRKSSYSGNTGGECIECAPLGAAAWRKSSYSGSTGGDCVEVAAQPCRIAVRDSKNPDGPAFAVAPSAFAAFVTAAAEGGL
ncbi:DUF397 domain-containing protein [Streptomyces sp. ISL-98]|uniref:DUF397 domain-containing protein n=1 Tax=Streptomyces sp. ISL-98 TaxID=2819192 RepID=UPI001BED18CD|nr:DUF397 domain-containing protein [Streptomyces sp. ISL-98]MBT2510968.1 DUF397 domain-containing protein [Streptomyces sp. ISL-98]